MSIIEVNHLTKEYRLGQLTSIKETAANALRRLAFRPVKRRERFKALDDVSFKIEENEIVGVIGQNGAGKSTLLKHLANITKPTKGNVVVRGSVAPLIEVSAGINPELTGRENIYLNGAILGIPKKVIRSKIDEIIEFSELSEFIDTPVKRYSSGMQVRLGFSIATTFEAQILIIDEVLAVGDLAFQRKCITRIDEMIKRNGPTILLVSHNLRQVARLCTRVILLDQGKIIADGDPSKICNDFYLQSNKKVQTTDKAQRGISNVRSSGEFELLEVNTIDANGNATDSIFSGDSLNVSVKFKLNAPLKKPEIVIGTHTTDFVYLTTSSSAYFDDRPDFEEGVHEIFYTIPSYPLVAGTYCIRLAIRDIYGRGIFNGETLKIFSVDFPPHLNIETIDEKTKYSLISTSSKWMIKNKNYMENINP